MKITKKKLQQIIKEEIIKLIKENEEKIVFTPTPPEELARRRAIPKTSSKKWGGRHPNWEKTEERAQQFIRVIGADPRLKSIKDNLAVALGMIRAEKRLKKDVSIPNQPRLDIKLNLEGTKYSDEWISYKLSVSSDILIRRRKKEEKPIAWSS